MAKKHSRKKDSKKQWLEEGFFFYDHVRPFYCYHCNQNFADWHNFYEHYKYVKKKIENQIKASIDPDYSEKYKEQAIQDRLKNNEDYKLLQQSYEENKKKRPFVCHICGKNFRNKKGLKRHYKKIHGIDYDQLRKERENKKNEEGSENDNQQKGSS